MFQTLVKMNVLGHIKPKQTLTVAKVAWNNLFSKWRPSSRLSWYDLLTASFAIELINLELRLIFSARATALSNTSSFGYTLLTKPANEKYYYNHINTIFWVGATSGNTKCRYMQRNKQMRCFMKCFCSWHLRRCRTYPVCVSGNWIVRIQACRVLSVCTCCLNVFDWSIYCRLEWYIVHITIILHIISMENLKVLAKRENKGSESSAHRVRDAGSMQ